MEDDSATRDFSDGSPSEEEGSSYVLSSEVEDVSSSWSEGEVSDSSGFETTHGKKRRKLGPPRPPPRPDNVQTRKLRPPQHLRQQKEATPPPPSESSLSSPEPEMSRELTEEEMERDLVTIRGMWEMATIFQFFHRFQTHLSLTATPVKMEEMEQAIAKSNGQGLLAQLHLDLMKGLKPRLGADASNWTAVLAKKLRSECLSPRDNPFKPERGNEALDYCNTPAVQRVLTLKLLCDIRCAENDVRDVFDLHLKPKMKNSRPVKKKHKTHVSQTSILRSAPLGQLNALTFFWLMESTEMFDFRLYKETREHVKKNGKMKAYTRVKSWELLASDLESLHRFGEELASTGTHSRNLKKKVLEELLPRLEKQIEREERKHKAAERIRQHECNIILDQHGGYGRSARTRTEAKYTFEEYERAMAEAIDEGRVDDLEKQETYLSDTSAVDTTPDDGMSFVQETSEDEPNGRTVSPHEVSDPDKLV